MDEITEYEASYCTGCGLHFDVCRCEPEADSDGVPEEVLEIRPSFLEWIKQVKREEGWR